MLFSINTFRVINLFAFNGFWYMLLLVAGGILPLSLSWLIAIYALFHLTLTPFGWRENLLIMATGLVGLSAELANQHWGFVTYRDTGLVLGIPLWIIMMWINFALSVAHTWGPWLKPWWSGLVLGALAAFFPYFGAEKAGILLVKQPLVVAAFWLIYGVFVSRAACLFYKQQAKQNQE